MIELDIHVYGSYTNLPEMIRKLRTLFEKHIGNGDRMPELAVSISPVIATPANRALVYVRLGSDELSDKRVIEACYEAENIIHRHFSSNCAGLTVEMRMIMTEHLPPRLQSQK